MFWCDKKYNIIIEKLDLILKEVKNMVDTLTDVDNALNADDTILANIANALQVLVSDSSQLIADVQALAGKSAPDTTPEVTHIQNQATALNAALSSIQSALANVVTADQAAGGSETQPSS